MLTLPRSPKAPMNKVGMIYAIAAFSAVVLAANPAFAQTDVFATLQTKSTNVFTDVRNLSYVLGAFGLIAIAVMAFFGRFNWKHFGGLIAGLVLIAAAAGFISFATTNSSTSTTSSSPGFTDTLGGGGAN